MRADAVRVDDTRRVIKEYRDSHPVVILDDYNVGMTCSHEARARYESGWYGRPVSGRILFIFGIFPKLTLCSIF